MTSNKLHIKRNSYDEYLFNHLYDKEVNGEEYEEQFESFKKDLFSSLFKLNNDYKDIDEIHPSFKLNREVLDKYRDNENWIQIYEFCNRNRSNTNYFFNKIRVNYKGYLELLKKEQEKENENENEEEENSEDEQEGERDDSEEDDETDGSSNNGDNGSSENDDGFKSVADLLNVLFDDDEEEDEEELEESNTEQNSKEVLKNIEEVIEEAKDEIDIAEHNEELSNGFCAISSSNKEGIEIEKLVPLKVDIKRLKQIYSIMGAFERIIVGEYSKTLKHSYGQVVGVTQGDSVEDVLTSELVPLFFPEIENIFYKNYADRTLLQLEHTSKRHSGKGSIVLCVDDSMSMYPEFSYGSDSQQRELRARSITLALIKLAQMQRRDLDVIIFDDEVDLVLNFEYGVTTPAEVLENIHKILTYHFESGTNFEEPIFKAIDIIKSKKYAKHADIIMITDGQAGFNKDEEFNKFKDKYETKLIVFNVDSSSNRYESDLDAIADKIINVKSIDDELVFDLAEELI